MDHWQYLIVLGACLLITPGDREDMILAALSMTLVDSKNRFSLAGLVLTGDIYPSGFLPQSAGNVRHMDLVDAYRTTPLFTVLRDSDALGGKCGECEYRKICGGSRARAFALYGDSMAEEPRCVYQPTLAEAAR